MLFLFVYKHKLTIFAVPYIIKFIIDIVIKSILLHSKVQVISKYSKFQFHHVLLIIIISKSLIQGNLIML